MIITTDAHVAANAIRSGKLVAIPTETVYGLAADATNDVAVSKIFAVKGRPKHHPLILHVSSVAELDTYVREIPATAKTLCDTFWPGPLTVVLRRREGVCDAAAGGLSTIAVRCPNHPLTLEMLRLASTAVAAPSANRFGRVSPTSVAHVATDLDDEVDVILDGGDCSVGLESTIVDCTVSPPVILRPGSISEEQIRNVVGDLGSTSETSAPGTLPSHYAPLCEVRLCEDRESADAIVQQMNVKGRSSRLIDYQSDLDSYARNLYADLRSCDSDGISIAVAVLPPPLGIGIAIRDRLLRAAHRD